MRARLEREQGVRASEIDAVVEELVGFGYLDDARYARIFAQDKRTLEQWGTERIIRTLRERGIDRDLITAALAAIQDAAEESELERAQTLLRQRFPAGPAQQRDRDRAFGVLVRKGYDSEVASDAVRAWARARD